MSIKHTATCGDCGWTSKPTRSDKQAAYALSRHSCARHLAKLESAKRREAREAAVDRAPKPCLHKRVSHQHGTHACYVLDQCRCRPCANANTAYERARNRAHAYGRFTHWVDPQPVRQHVRDLMAAGMGLKRVGELSGYSQGAMTRLIYGSRERGMVPTKRIRAEHADAILAVRASVGTLAGGARIDNTGTVRRLQALMVIGWSQTRLAHALGYEVRNFGYLLHGQRAVTVSTARKVRDLYEQLWDQAPPSANRWARGSVNRSKAYAAQRGWVPPLAWDDDTIDDPAARPTTGADVDHQYLDQAAILRRIDGDHKVPLTNEERREVVRILHTRGLNDREIERLAGINQRQVIRDRQTIGLPANAASGERGAA